MNLNDFNRYAEDFAEKKVIAGRGVTSNVLAQMQAQQQMVASSTSVSVFDGLGLNELGEIIPLRNK